MKYLLILSIISLSVVLACHSSCNCDVGSNVCKSCKEANIGAKVDANQRSCPCPAGWYSDVTVTTNTIPANGPAVCDYDVVYGDFEYFNCMDYCQSYETLEEGKALCIVKPTCKAILQNVVGRYVLIDTDVPVQHYNHVPIWIEKNCHIPKAQTTTTFSTQCKRLINTDGNGKEIAVEMDACKLEIGLKTKDMKVLTDCHFENIGGKSYVVSDVKLDVISANFNLICLDAIRTKLLYKSPNNGQYIDLPAKYITNNPSGNKTITIPLIDVFDLCTSQSVNDDQIIQIINLKMLIGHEDSWVRSHKWNLIVYTNRDQVEVFQIDVDIQETEGCQPGQECIVIADLDTLSDVYTDGTFANVHSPPHKYLVGDIFYAKIRFADPTYKKRLDFIKLYFKTDTNKIFNFSSITTASWDGTGLRISLPLVQPSQGAIIQVNMKISTLNARHLAGEEQTVQTKFVASVYDKTGKGISTNTDSNSSDSANNVSNANILLGLSALFTLFLLF